MFFTSIAIVGMLLMLASVTLIVGLTARVFIWPASLFFIGIALIIMTVSEGSRKEEIVDIAKCYERRTEIRSKKVSDISISDNKCIQYFDELDYYYFKEGEKE